MNKEEKIKIAKKIYDRFLKDYDLEIRRDEEIKAVFIWVLNQRGPGGLIISDDGSYLFCQSRYGYDYWKEEFKKGIRSNSES